MEAIGELHSACLGQQIQTLLQAGPLLGSGT